MSQEIPSFLHDYVVVDLETTGFDSNRNEIIEFAAIRVINGQPVSHFQRLIKPAQAIPQKITEITGITNEMVAHAESIREVLPHFLDFLGGSVVIGHNVQFDAGFLRAQAEKIGRQFNNDTVDTLRIARTLLPGLSSYKLESIAAHLGVVPAGAHRALADASTAFGIYEKLRQVAYQTSAPTFDRPSGSPAPNAPYGAQPAHQAFSWPSVPEVISFRTPWIGYSRPIPLCFEIFFVMPIKLTLWAMWISVALIYRALVNSPSSPRASSAQPTTGHSPNQPVAVRYNAHSSSTYFQGKTVVFTGQLSRMKRDEAHEAVAFQGGEPKTNITKQTDFLVVAKSGHRSSAKFQKALEYARGGSSTNIISEDEFYSHL